MDNNSPLRFSNVAELRNHLLAKLQSDSLTMVYTDVEQFLFTQSFDVYKQAIEAHLDKDEELVFAVRSARAKRQAELLSAALSDSRNYRLAYTAISDDDQRSRQSANWKSEKDKEAEKKPAVPEIQVKIVDTTDTAAVEEDK